MRVRARDIALALAVVGWPLAMLGLLDAGFTSRKYMCCQSADAAIMLARWLLLGMAPAVALAFGPRGLRLLAASVWTLMSVALAVTGTLVFTAGPLVASSGSGMILGAIVLALGGAFALLASVRGGGPANSGSSQ